MGFSALFLLYSRDTQEERCRLATQGVSRNAMAWGLPFEEVNSVRELYYHATCFARVTGVPVVGSEGQRFCYKRGSVDCHGGVGELPELSTGPVLPRLTKIIRSGITFVSRNVISRRFL